MKNRILFHCGSRGVRGGLLFEKPAHFDMFFDILGTLCNELGVRVVEYALMTNHLHLLLDLIPELKAQFLQRLNWLYAVKYNLDTGQHGHVFEERCWAFTRMGAIVTPQTMAYIAINPPKAGLSATPEAYAYSGYAAAIGLRRPFPWHRPELGLHYLSPNLREARMHYRKLVEYYSKCMRDMKCSGGRWISEHPHSSTRAINTASEVEFATLIDLHIAEAISRGTLEVPLGLDGFDMRLLAMKWMASVTLRQIATVWDMWPHAVSWRMRQIVQRLDRMPGAAEDLRNRLSECLKRAPSVGQISRTEMGNG